MAAEAYLLLEDGTRFDGEACGAPGRAVGEVVFTTGMSGYQESMSDPSFAGQLITFTYPHIGNYGTSAAAMESARPWARAAIMRAARNSPGGSDSERPWLDWLADWGVPAISGVDTRALVRHIRQRRAMRGGLFPAELPEDEARALIGSEPEMSGRNLAAEVSPSEVVRLRAEADLDRLLGRAPGGARDASSAAGAPLDAVPGGEGGAPGAPLRVAVLDTGVKASIVRQLLARGAEVELHPCTSSAEQLLAADPHAILLANGPGDPAALGEAVGTVRQLLGARPVWGICLGHQLLCRALGLETFKLPFGHRGANHPVKDLRDGGIAITSQNHGFAVLAPGRRETLERDEAVEWDTDFGAARLTHVNLYDRTVEGLELLEVPGASVQYHPEAGPGPHDSLHLFDRFLAGVGADRPGMPGRAAASAERSGAPAREGGR